MTIDFEECQSLLEGSASQLGSNSPTPIPLRPICRELGVCGVRRDRLEGAKSLLIDAKTKPVIILNTSVGGTGTQSERFTRLERFLIAHELGHLVLVQCGVRNPSGTNEYWKMEKLCDAFARRLLMPEGLVSSLINEMKPTALERLAATLKVVRNFSVHWAAAAMRVAGLTNDTVFFRLAKIPEGGFKIVVSTHPNERGIGQLIKPGTSLYETLEWHCNGLNSPHEIAAEELEGIRGITGVRSGALHADRLAVMPRTEVISA
jgi:hypothetical protein